MKQKLNKCPVWNINELLLIITKKTQRFFEKVNTKLSQNSFGKKEMKKYSLDAA